jgi:Na+-translocating ferredoxin:NAD+ oxidoreductase RNF subunit RnfB
MAKGAGKARKKLPKELAVVSADNCTGCEACIEVCPVDCIYKIPAKTFRLCSPSWILTWKGVLAADFANGGAPGTRSRWYLPPESTKP